MERWYWKTDELLTLDSGVEADLLARFGYSPNPSHTHAVIIDIVVDGETGTRCAGSVPFSFNSATFTGAVHNLESAIHSAAETALSTIRNTGPLTSVVGRLHAL